MNLLLLGNIKQLCAALQPVYISTSYAVMNKHLWWPRHKNIFLINTPSFTDATFVHRKFLENFNSLDSVAIRNLTIYLRFSMALGIHQKKLNVVNAIRIHAGNTSKYNPRTVLNTQLWVFRSLITELPSKKLVELPMTDYTRPHLPQLASSNENVFREKRNWRISVK